MHLLTGLAVVTIVASLYALSITFARRARKSRPRYRVEASESRRVDLAGNETVSWSVSYWDDGSFLGRALRRYHVARVDRAHRKKMRRLGSLTSAAK